MPPAGRSGALAAGPEPVYHGGVRRVLPVVLVPALLALGACRTRDDGATASTLANPGRDVSTTVGTVAAVTATTPAPVAPASAAPSKAVPACRPAVPPGTRGATLTVGDATRTYTLHQPPEAGGLRALVLNLHGLNASGAQQLAYSGAAAAADAAGMVVASPDAVDGQWRVGGDDTDVRFLVALVDELLTVACVDPARTYVMGLSNGAAMTAALACRAGSRFAAFGAVAGAPYVEAACSDSPPAAIWLMHGTDDELVPYRTAGTAAEGWAGHAACPGPPVDEVVGSEVTTRVWAGCANGTEVRLTTIAGGGHTWPGAASRPAVERVLGSTTTQIDATAAFFEFFARHLRRRGP